MEIWHIWIIIGIAFLVWEVFTPGFFVASIGVGAFFAAITSYFGGGATYQVISIIIGALITFLFIRPLFLWYQKSKGDNRETGTYALIGQTALVLESIKSNTNEGRVKVKGEEWKACSSCGDNIEEGDLVVVEKIEGATAFVKKQVKEI